MKLFSACLLWLQAILFIVLTILALWIYHNSAGGGFDARFASIQFGRLIAFLAPYLALPISIVFTLLFYKKGKYSTAIWSPLVFIALIFAAGQLHLKIVPDPIQENFRARPAPYQGFLVLPQEAVPEGFQEVKHNYTKSEYTISYTRTVEGQKIDLDIVEGDRIIFGLDGSEPVQEFEYLGIIGQVYIHRHKKTQKTSYNLIWLNPPKQRIAIYLTQTLDNEYSPEDLIKILQNMKEI